MSNLFDITKRIYPFLNCATVTSTIDGDIYTNKRPLNSAKRDVVIKASLRDADGLDAQPGMLIVNCYAPTLRGGRVDSANLETTADAIASRIDLWNQGSTYCHIENSYTALIEHEDREDVNYVTMQFNIFIE